MIGEYIQLHENQRYTEISGGDSLNRMNPHLIDCIGIISRIFNRFNGFLDSLMTKLNKCESKLTRINDDLDSFRVLDWVVMRSIRENSFRGAGGEIGSKYAYLPIANNNREWPDKLGLGSLTSVKIVKDMNDDKIIQFLDFYCIWPKGSPELNKVALLRYIGASEEYQ